MIPSVAGKKAARRHVPETEKIISQHDLDQDGDPALSG